MPSSASGPCDARTLGGQPTSLTAKVTSTVCSRLSVVTMQTAHLWRWGHVTELLYSRWSLNTLWVYLFSGFRLSLLGKAVLSVWGPQAVWVSVMCLSSSSIMLTCCCCLPKMSASSCYQDLCICPMSELNPQLQLCSCVRYPIWKVMNDSIYFKEFITEAAQGKVTFFYIIEINSFYPAEFTRIKVMKQLWLMFLQ